MQRHEHQGELNSHESSFMNYFRLCIDTIGIDPIRFDWSVHSGEYNRWLCMAEWQQEAQL